MTKQELIDEIFKITEVMQKDYPEVYKNLQETPLFLDREGDKHESLEKKDLEQYLNTLRTQLDRLAKMKIIKAGR